MPLADGERRRGSVGLTEHDAPSGGTATSVARRGTSIVSTPVGRRQGGLRTWRGSGSRNQEPALASRTLGGGVGGATGCAVISASAQAHARRSSIDSLSSA